MEVTYKAPSFRDRIFAFGFDFTLSVITFLFLIWGAFSIVKGLPFYKQANENLNNYEKSTHLYVIRDDGNTQLLCDFYTVQTEEEYEDYYKKLDEALTLFYTDPNFFDQTDPKSGLYIYNTYKIPEGETYSDIFIYSDETHAEIVKKEDVSYKKAYDFCCNIMSSKAVHVVANSDIYISNSRTIMLSFVFLVFLIPLVIVSLIYQLIIPLCISRGKKTLGKLLFQISVLDSRGLSCSWKRYLARFSIHLFLETILSFATFLIPLIISFTMYLRSKSGQCLHDYLSNTYVLSAPIKSVCKTKEEYIAKNVKDKNFELDKDDVAY